MVQLIPSFSYNSSTKIHHLPNSLSHVQPCGSPRRLTTRTRKAGDVPLKMGIGFKREKWWETFIWAADGLLRGFLKCGIPQSATGCFNTSRLGHPWQLDDLGIPMGTPVAGSPCSMDIFNEHDDKPHISADRQTLRKSCDSYDHSKSNELVHSRYGSALVHSKSVQNLAKTDIIWHLSNEPCSLSSVFPCFSFICVSISFFRVAPNHFRSMIVRRGSTTSRSLFYPLICPFPPWYLWCRAPNREFLRGLPSCGHRPWATRQPLEAGHQRPERLEEMCHPGGSPGAGRASRRMDWEMLKSPGGARNIDLMWLNHLRLEAIIVVSHKTYGETGCCSQAKLTGSLGRRSHFSWNQHQLYIFAVRGSRHLHGGTWYQVKTPKNHHRGSVWKWDTTDCGGGFKPHYPLSFTAIWCFFVLIFLYFFHQFWSIWNKSPNIYKHIQTYTNINHLEKKSLENHTTPRGFFLFGGHDPCAAGGLFGLASPGASMALDRLGFKAAPDSQCWQQSWTPIRFFLRMQNTLAISELPLKLPVYPIKNIPNVWWDPYESPSNPMKPPYYSW